MYETESGEKLFTNKPDAPGNDDNVMNDEIGFTNSRIVQTSLVTVALTTSVSMGVLLTYLTLQLVEFIIR